MTVTMLINKERKMYERAITLLDAGHSEKEVGAMLGVSELRIKIYKQWRDNHKEDN